MTLNTSMFNFNATAYTVPEKRPCTQTFYQNAMPKNSITQSKFISQLRALTSFKATAYTVSDKRPCMQRFNQVGNTDAKANPSTNEKVIT